jgi:dCTP deaminase
MSVLSRSLIQARLKLPITNPGALVITPLLRPDEAFDHDSIDLRLGSHFILSKSPAEPLYFPSAANTTLASQRVHVPLGQYLVIPAHQTVLGCTLEFIKLPYDVSGQILTKSSVARTFMVIETAPWIHPSYRGCLTLEIANVSNTPLLLYPGRLIGQLILMTLIGADAREQEKMSGTYMGPVYPETPSFKDPHEDLAKLGILDVAEPSFRRR